jgi:NAD(P)H dehydrogenase (quinone)
MNAQRYEDSLSALGSRLDRAMHDAPIAYRSQNQGDYLIPELTLKPELGAQHVGFALHTSPRAAPAPLSDRSSESELLASG